MKPRKSTSSLFRIFIPLGLGCLAIVTALAHPPHGGDGADTGVLTGFTPFIDTLPVPADAAPVGTTNGALLYEIPMTVIPDYRFHPELPPVEVWGYAGSSPGPTLQVTNGIPIYVRWINQLPATYPPWLAANPMNHGVTNQDVRNVVHLHGGANRPEYDGHPTNTFRPGESRLYLYENIDFTGDGETLWYHDHAVGVTANNVYAGLAGFCLLRHPDLEASLGLPQRPYEIPLVFQDRDIITNAVSTNLYFPAHRAWYSLPVVNGKVAPYLEVEPRTYRFRLLNGCVNRTLGLAAVSGTNTVTLHQIGTDDGFLTHTVRIPDDVSTLRLMPGERADVLVDFAAAAAAGLTNIVVQNQFATDSAANPPSEPINVVGGQFLQFRVRGNPPAGGSPPIPTVLVPDRESAADLASRAVRTRTVTLDLRNELLNLTPNQPPGPSPGGTFTKDLHVFALLNLSHFDEPVTETPTAGDIEVWEFVNLTPMAHPMHIHLIDFFLLERLGFQGARPGPPGTNLPPAGVTNYINDRTAGQLLPLTNYLAGPRPTQPNEAGPKDVIHAAPWAVTRVVIQWPDDARFVGPYVYHCHLLDHEDNDMMRPLELLLPPGKLGIVHDPVDTRIVVKLGTAPGIRYDLLQSNDTLENWRATATVEGTGLPAMFRTPLIAEAGATFYQARTVP